MVILTGAAGFIGSVLLKRLNERGVTDIVIVDSPGEEKSLNLRKKTFQRYLDKDEFLKKLDTEIKPSDVECIIHMGACTSTTERDLDYLRKNNFEYSQTLAKWCFAHDKQFIYASSAATYGDGALGFSDANNKAHGYRPLNPYGDSKQMFDLWLIDNGFDTKCTGFKFFNVFGPNEYHKGEMASLVYKAYNQIKRDGALRLFKSYNPRYEDGEFVRDFIYVKDCLDVVLWAFEHREVTGIFNLGTGKARSWNDLARALFSAMQAPENIRYIDMPESIREAYQYYTEADMSKIRADGYLRPFSSLEDSVNDYVQEYLSKTDPYY
jgi:ADP-L-glycero-D-manno-heptose 6-epimerase